MAPKKPTKSKQPKQLAIKVNKVHKSTSGVQGNEAIFVDMDTTNMRDEFMGRYIVLERGLKLEPPHDELIKKLGLETLIDGCSGKLDGLKSLLYEFLANLHSTRVDKFMVREKLVNISAEAINAFYKL